MEINKEINLKKVITTKTLNVDFHYKFIKFWIFFSIFLYYTIYTSIHTHTPIYMHNMTSA